MANDEVESSDYFLFLNLSEGRKKKKCLGGKRGNEEVEPSDYFLLLNLKVEEEEENATVVKWPMKRWSLGLFSLPYLDSPSATPSPRGSETGAYLLQRQVWTVVDPPGPFAVARHRQRAAVDVVDDSSGVFLAAQTSWRRRHDDEHHHRRHQGEEGRRRTGGRHRRRSSTDWWTLADGVYKHPAPSAPRGSMVAHTLMITA